ncbi:M81 family metallopeptidase [Litorisediminicola beolgyonensis]|uniref:Microcystinase C n=1 Tax=Litorisediminicola beolgyonensis TaxID=1173614 RepID=A0ABW3ZJQ1_9RHOB
MKVAIAGFLHETNTFAPVRADVEAFRTGGGYIPMVEGADILEAAQGVNLGISGALEIAQECGWQVQPILWAGAIPSAHVTCAAYERIAGRIVDGIAALGEIDGVFLDLHGAMVAEHLDDGEAELAGRVRELVGPDVPVVAALDLHGNIGAAMVAALDAYVGFRTYPHIDMAETGRRAARLLDRMMATGTRPAKAFRRMSYLVPIPFQCTDLDPARELYTQTAELEAGDVWSTSLFMGFPAADIPDCGPTAVAFAETQAEADAAADRIASLYEAAEDRFAGQTFSPQEAIAEALRLKRAGTSGPVILADTQDNPGAGGISATTGILRAMVEAGVENAALGVIVDPETARLAHEAGQGALITCRLGGHRDLPDAPPFKTDAAVEALSDGRLTASGPYYGGTKLDLGPSACLRIGGVRVAVTSRIAQTADREMFRFLGIAPEEMSLVSVKSSTHFRADFAPIAGAILVTLSPGPMPFDPADLPFTRLRPGLRLSPGGPAFVAPAPSEASAKPLAAAEHI